MYCGKLLSLVSIPRAKNLSPEAKAVEERAIELVKSGLKGLIAEYRKRFGPLIGTDFARELFPEYAASRESRTLNAAAVQKSAAHVADSVFERAVVEGIGRSEQPIAVFTAGGTGAGKTSSIQANTTTNDVLNEAQLVYDSNLNSFNSAKQKVDFALKHGYRVLIIFILREPVPAFTEGVLPRAVREGRTVPIDGHVRMHKDSLKTFLRLRKYYQGNQNVEFMVLSNTGAEGEVALGDVERLNEVRYDTEELEHELQERLEREYSGGKISKAIYDCSRIR